MLEYLWSFRFARHLQNIFHLLGQVDRHIFTLIIQLWGSSQYPISFWTVCIRICKSSFFAFLGFSFLLPVFMKVLLLTEVLQNFNPVPILILLSFLLLFFGGLALMINL